MRIKCGKTGLQKNLEKTEWHKWFAWYPVRVGEQERRWLEYVNRKLTFSWDYIDVEYRAIEVKDD